MAEQQPQQQPLTILLFARGVLALLDLWPALTIAVAEQWGGTDSAAKKTWLASILIDEFETRAPLLPVTDTNSVPTVDPNSANDPPLDIDEVGDLLHQIMSDEFDANLEDGSIDIVATDLVKLWKDLLNPLYDPQVVVDNLEKQASEVRRKGINAQVGAGGAESQSEGEDSDADEDVEMDEAPQLVDSREPKERQEPVVDDDGFTLVQKKGGRR